MYDLLIKNGRVLDGTGSPWFRADVAVVGDRIVAMGRLDDREAAQTIDAAGNFVAPGFIEEHSHADVTVLVDPLAQSCIRQGMTTLVVGNCGHAAAPVKMDMVDDYRAGAAIYEVDGYDWTWETMGEYRDTVREARTSCNVVAMTGHLNVRHVVMGEANRPATPDERTKMRELVAAALADGARGFSTGLMYQHTVFSDTDEVVEMAKALAPYGWAYHTHIRDYGRHLQKAVAEAIEIAERAEVPLVVSHMYPAGKEYWGQAGACIEMLEKARDRGLEVGFDVTPWLRGGGPFISYFPPWAREGGMAMTLDRVRDPEISGRIVEAIEAGEYYSFAFGWDDQLVHHVADPKYRSWLGKSIGEIARERGEDPGRTAMSMVLADEGKFGVAPTNKCDDDVDMLIKHPLGIPVADGRSLAPTGPLAYQDRPNSYGTFPRVLGRYVRERGILTWEEAVQKMAAIPASRVGLWDRGVLREGMAADIVIFDPDTVIEKADYANPQEYPEGMPWVIVNGKVTVAPEGHTGARAGYVL